MKSQIVKLITLAIFIVSLAACTGMEGGLSELDEESAAQLDNSIELDLAAEPEAQAKGDDVGAAAECSGDVTCPSSFNNCTFLGDFDCGEEFCRTPGQQCGGQLSTFIRVSHVSRCTDPAGNVCIAIRQGRRLVHCGC